MTKKKKSSKKITGKDGLLRGMTVYLVQQVDWKEFKSALGSSKSDRHKKN